MHCTAVLVLVITAASAVYTAVDTEASFVERKECENDQLCVYKYSAVQEEFRDEVTMNASVTTTVVVSCDAVGEYGQRQATRLCLTFRDTKISLTGRQDESYGSGTGSGDDGTVPEGLADKMFAGWFCFVQTDDGKVVTIYHSKDDLPDIVNFKKGVAAAFQDNFKHTEEEEEDDPQSKHRSHYTYESKDDIAIVHRVFDSSDVVEYPFHVPRDDVELAKDEYLIYRSGMLEHSAGNIHVKLFPSTGKPRSKLDMDDERTYDESFDANVFSVSGSYSMDIDYCYSVPRATARRRRETQENLAKGYVQSGLTAHHNQTAHGYYQMKLLRQAIPSVPVALLALHHNQSGSKLVSQLQQLLKLEAEYGVLPGFSPALPSVLDYFQKVLISRQPEDSEVRLVLYTLLSAEGSHDSQEALLHALDQVADEKERNTLITFIAFLRNASSSFVSQLEKRIGPYSQSTDTLLLAYGALASTASPEVQNQIVLFLQSQLNAAQDDPVVLVHVIHSLGNTGCSTTVNILIGFLSDSNRSVKLAAINALRKHTSNILVQTKFVSMVREQNISPEDFEAILQALMFGFEHQKLNRLGYTEDPNILSSLVSTAVKLGDSNLQQLLIGYLLDLNTIESHHHLGNLQTWVPAPGPDGNDTNARSRRGTDWDESNSLYNLVASYSSRSSDVQTYPYHRAYIWAKQFGVNKLNCKVAAGGFIGVDAAGNYFKLFGKAVAQGYAFGYTSTALNAEILVEKEHTNWHVKFYAQVAGHVLVNSDQQYSLSWSYDWPLYSSPRYTIIHADYPIFIYVGLLHFTIDVFAELRVDANMQAQVDVVSSASAAIIPKATLTAQASATASLLELIQGGIRVQATISYQVEPRASTDVCIPQLRVQNCLNVYDEWPSSYVDIYAFYQFRNILWCGSWIPYPCGFTWGNEHRWDAASIRWNLPSSSRRSIYGACDASLPTCLVV